MDRSRVEMHPRRSVDFRHFRIGPGNTHADTLHRGIPDRFEYIVHSIIDTAALHRPVERG